MLKNVNCVSAILDATQHILFKSKIGFGIQNRLYSQYIYYYIDYIIKILFIANLPTIRMKPLNNKDYFLTKNRQK